jgi:hypothetical protein
MVPIRPALGNNRVRPGKLSASGPQRIERAGACSPTAHCIYNHAHLDTNSGALHEILEKLSCQFPLEEFVCFQMDRVFCGSNGLPCSGVKRLSIPKNGNASIRMNLRVSNRG